jgi:hypothetical protein
MIRIGAINMTDNTRGEKFLNHFLNFIFMGKGMMIGMNIGRKDVVEEGNGMILNTMRRGKSLGSGKNKFMFGEDGLKVRMHEGCLSGLNGMELHNNVKMNFFEDLFHAMGTDDHRGTCYDALELILLALLV